MDNTIALKDIHAVVTDSQKMKHEEGTRVFEYKLRDKNVKSKMIKGAKRVPFEIFENSSSSNLVFNLGAWQNIVLPSIRYWSQSQDGKSCIVGDTTIKVADVKIGKDTGGKNVDSKVVFFSNRDKIVCHFYNTTTLCLVNGHGYNKFINNFLKPYFESRIAMNLEEIKDYNEQALQVLINKADKRSNLKHTSGSTSLWCTKCDYAAKSRAALVKHKKSHNALSFKSNSTSSSVKTPKYHSTRNNTFTEALLQENITVTDLTNDKSIEISLKYTCLECKFKTTQKSEMNGWTLS